MFEQLCSCLVIVGMSQATLKWKLFPFSLTGRAKQWYSLNVRSMEGDWERLWKAFCLTFSLTPRVVKLWREVICFEQRRTESLGAAWARFMKTVESGPDLGIAEPVLLQHFRDGLIPESVVFIDSSSGGSFDHPRQIRRTHAKHYLETKTHRGGTHFSNHPIRRGLHSSNKNIVHRWTIPTI
jgi:hypothetical protein